MKYQHLNERCLEGGGNPLADVKLSRNNQKKLVDTCGTVQHGTLNAYCIAL